MALISFKKCTVLLSTLLLTTSVFAAKYTLNVSTALATDDPIYKGLVEFKKNVEQRSNKQLTIRIFPGSQLGSDEDIIEQIKAGAGTALITDGARLEIYTKQFGVLNAPYIAKNFAEMRKVVTSPLFNEWSAHLRDNSGFQVFSFNWYQGARHLVTNNPVNVPADLTGVRMRTIGAPQWLETIRALGATPTPLPWAEVYSAMQLKAIDAVEAQFPAINSSRLYEVSKYVTKTYHVQLITGLVGSKIWFDKLPNDLKTILLEESLKAGDFASQLTLDSLAQLEKDIAAKGVTINEIDVTPFVESTEVIYSKFGYQDLRKEIDKIISE